MRCAHCNEDLEGTATVHGERVFHTACVNAARQARAGRTYQCPKCSGSGWEFNDDFPEVEMQDPSEGYNGYFSNLVPVAKMVHRSKKCDFCEGFGYLASKPKPIVEPARIVGWNKG